MTQREFKCIINDLGQTIFCEYTSFDRLHRTHYVTRPMVISTTILSDGSEGVKLMPWMPYTDDVEFKFRETELKYIGNLKPSFVSFFGNSVIKDEINNINRSGFDRIKAGEDPTDVAKSCIELMKKACDDIGPIFGLNPEEAKDTFELHSLDEAETDGSDVIDETPKSSPVESNTKKFLH